MREIADLLATLPPHTRPEGRNGLRRHLVDGTRRRVTALERVLDDVAGDERLVGLPAAPRRSELGPRSPPSEEDVIGTVFAATVPFFLVLGVGMVAGYTRRFATAEPAINAFVFWVALPAFLFESIAGTDPSAGVPAAVPLVAVGVTSLVSVAAYALARHVGPLRSTRPAPFSLAAGYGNVGYLGVPLVITLVGGGSALAAGITSLLHNLLFMVGYPLVRTLVAHRGGDRSGGLPVWPVLKGALVANPVALSIGAGLVAAFVHVRLPAFLDTTVAMLGQAAVPGAMFAIGLTLRPALAGVRAGGVSRLGVGVATAIKMVAAPAATLLAVRMLDGHLLGPWGPALVVMAAMPVSATAFLLAQTYDDEGRFTATTIVTTSLAAVVLVPLFAAAAGV